VTWRGRRGSQRPSAEARHVIDAKLDCGARGDTRVLRDGAIEASQRRLDAASAQFTAEDVGKSVIVQGAGAGVAAQGDAGRVAGAPTAEGALTVEGALHCTIESVRDGAAILSESAGGTVGGATVTYGADDTVALRAAIADGVARGRAVHIPAGNYLCSGPICAISSTVAGEQGPVVYGDGAAVTILTAYLPGSVAQAAALFDVRGSVGPRIPAPDLGAAGGRVLTLPSSAGLARDQLLYLIDEGQPFLGRGSRSPAGYAGELVRICEVLSSTQVLTYGGLEYTYGPGAHYQQPAHLDGFTLRELTIRNPAPATQSVAARALTLRLVNNVRIENVRFESLDGCAIRLSRAHDFRVQGCEFLGLQQVRTDNNPYGICCAEWCSSGLVIGCNGDVGCHLFTTGCNPRASPPNHIVVANCVASNHTKAAFDTHPGSRFITFTGNQVHGCSGPAFQIRGPDCQVIEPVVSGLGPAAGDEDGRSAVGVYFVFGADRGRLRGGRIAGVHHGVIIRDSSEVSVVGTRLQNVRECGVEVTRDGSYPTPVNIAIDDVDIVGASAATGLRFGVWDDSYRVERVRCRGLARDVEGAGEASAWAGGELLEDA
jgi:hypothetical protein